MFFCICMRTYHLKKNSRNAEAGVSSLPLFDVSLFLRPAHALELEVAVVGLRSDSLALKDDEGNGSDDLILSALCLVYRFVEFLGTLTGMKFSGKYMKYRTIAAGVNLANGLPANLPSLAITSPAPPPLT